MNGDQIMYGVKNDSFCTVFSIFSIIPSLSCSRQLLRLSLQKPHPQASLSPICKDIHAAAVAKTFTMHTGDSTIALHALFSRMPVGIGRVSGFGLLKYAGQAGLIETPEGPLNGAREGCSWPVLMRACGRSLQLSLRERGGDPQDLIFLELASTRPFWVEGRSSSTVK